MDRITFRLSFCYERLCECPGTNREVTHKYANFQFVAIHVSTEGVLKIQIPCPISVPEITGVNTKIYSHKKILK